MNTKTILCILAGTILGISSSQIPANATNLFSDYTETVSLGNEENQFSIDYRSNLDAKYTTNQFEETQVIISCLPKEHTVFSVKNDQTFKYKLHIPDNCYYEYVEDDQNENDQAILIYDTNNLLIGYIENLIPDNDDISVKLSIKDNILTQYYSYSSKDLLSTLNTDTKSGINIVATQAEKFSTYFTDGKWITRSNQISLSLYRRIILETVAQRNAAWSTVNFRFNSSSNWKNTTGMKDQFMCHSYFAKSKNPWNLEPWRPNVGYAQTVSSGCNP